MELANRVIAVSFAVHPGAVDTDASENSDSIDSAPETYTHHYSYAAQALLKVAPVLAAYPLITVEESVNGVLARVDEATREKLGGTFLGHEGNTLPW